MWKLLVALGTRPEAIKLGPVVHRLREHPSIDVVVCNVGQHAGMLDETLAAFDVAPAHDLEIIRPGQSLDALTARALTRLGDVLDDERPDMVVVQGDTTTVLIAALAGFYRHIPVAHVEAGLRTGIPDLPFPEEMNRRLTGTLATLHFAPTPGARDNLLAENVAASAITVTGNTVIDALFWMLDHGPPPPPEIAALLEDPRRRVVVTAHRRESWGEPMRDIGRALAGITRAREDVLVIFPIHPNPIVRDAIAEHTTGIDRISIIEPLPYPAFVRLMAGADVLLTDSGGIQEEAAALAKPVLVMRDVTERAEGVDAGVARLVGRDADAIVAGVLGALDHPLHPGEASNPFGDGKASERILEQIVAYLERS